MGGVAYLYLNTTSNSTESISLITTKSISEFLKEEKLQLITDANDSEWTTKWGKFLDAYTNESPRDNWAIDDWNTEKSKRNVVPQKFKDNCNNNGSQKVENKKADIYEKVKAYCTKALIK